MLIQQASVVIRTLNEEASLGRLLDELAAQIGGPKLDVLVVDSGSTDATVAIARSKGARVIEIPAESFHYSRALNLGIENTQGELVVILSAHSIPCTRDWLSRVAARFIDPEVAGVFTRQVAWPSAYWREVVRIRNTYGDAVRSFGPAESGQSVPFSNAASCVRRSVWQARPFTLPAAEDTDWATWAVSQGHRIVSEASVAVFHSHDESSRDAARRLIHLEQSADLKLGRTRSLPLTVRQAIGALARDTVELTRYEPSLLRRLPLIWESSVRSFWFVRDF